MWLIFGPHRYRVLEVVLWISGINLLGAVLYILLDLFSCFSVSFLPKCMIKMQDRTMETIGLIL